MVTYHLAYPSLKSQIFHSLATTVLGSEWAHAAVEMCTILDQLPLGIVSFPFKWANTLFEFTCWYPPPPSHAPSMWLNSSRLLLSQWHKAYTEPIAKANSERCPRDLQRLIHMQLPSQTSVPVLEEGSRQLSSSTMRKAVVSLFPWKQLLMLLLRV